MIYEEMISREYLKFIQSMEAIQKELEELPKGSIHIHTIKGKAYLYLHYNENRERKIRRLQEENLEIIRRDIAKRRALEKQLAIYRKEQSCFIRALRIAHLDPDMIQETCARVRLERREEQRKYQEELMKAQKKPYSEQYRIPTLRGELVASKSEMMIANALARRDLTYQYENKVCMDGITIKPDFTIVYGEQTYYWEHCGLMDDEKYTKMWEFKKALYNKEGFVEGDTLIVTHETQKKPLTEQLVERMIEIYFG